ncbi:MAG: alpha/beta hydrolase [Synergistaceae bacterium]|jgi:acetyl esterase|nr:alpha/beta hydrolase [Synergistaceae bacterium]
MPLDPQTKKLLDVMKSSGLPPINELPVSDARKRVIALFPNNGRLVPIGSVGNRTIPMHWGEMPCRIYSPEGDGPFPVLTYIHGGGWTINNVDIYDSACRHITKNSECIVVSIEYRLAPEVKFPEQLEDEYRAVEWIHRNARSFNGDPLKFAIGGDSSGGNQATVICLMSRDRGGPDIKYQLLIYPVTDYYMPFAWSCEEYGTDYFGLGKDQMTWFWNNYLKDGADVNDPYISPLRAKSLKGLPAAHIVTAEYDAVRDAGEEYAKKLRDAGVNVKLSRCDGLAHGFIQHWRVVDKALASLAEMGREMKNFMSSL